MTDTANKRPRIDLNVNLGHILMMVTIIVSVIGASWKMSERLTMTETKLDSLSSQFTSIIDRQAATDTRQDQEIDRIEQHQRDDFREINAKLDRIMSRQSEQ